jgi:hypothetical protein
MVYGVYRGLTVVSTFDPKEWTTRQETHPSLQHTNNPLKADQISSISADPCFSLTFSSSEGGDKFKDKFNSLLGIG